MCHYRLKGSVFIVIFNYHIYCNFNININECATGILTTDHTATADGCVLKTVSFSFLSAGIIQKSHWLVETKNKVYSLPAFSSIYEGCQASHWICWENSFVFLPKLRIKLITHFAKLDSISVSHTLLFLNSALHILYTTNRSICTASRG